MGGQVTDGSKAPIRLAAVQARALPGQIEANLEHAARLIEQAAGQGAAMVVLPELSTCGYVPNRAIWAVAEARGGRTDRWLAPPPGGWASTWARAPPKPTVPTSSTCSPWPARTGRSPGAPTRPTRRPASSGAAAPRT